MHRPRRTPGTPHRGRGRPARAAVRVRARRRGRGRGRCRRLPALGAGKPGARRLGAGRCAGVGGNGSEAVSDRGDDVSEESNGTAQASAARRAVALIVNGREHVVQVEPRTLLVDAIRDHVGLTGTHIGCDSTSCGACTVLLDDRPVKSCTLFAVQAEGSRLRTVESVGSDDGTLHPLQQAFEDEFAFQCGYCTAGMLMSSLAMYERDDPPDRGEIRRCLVGNLCRCTGYESIVDAVELAVTRRGAADQEAEAR
ncbi:MAG: 2Fe-2S iron-sulfur cluster binding domain-containing protein [Streptosporangiales bacterium]|nr:2Fe-2S iron-sulfur cluster binding domain-containing protein [Streptosporangiales bacterium]